MTEKQPPDPHIDYPCWWTYAIIGEDEEKLRLAAGAITQGTQHKIGFSKESLHKRYVSLHVEIWVLTEEERDTHFNAFRTHPHVRAII